MFDGAETTTNDKVNDNLFFSCCCGQQGHFLWRKVCDCRTTTYTCNRSCIVGALRDENRYYRASINLYSNVTELYPNSTVWLSGHSLGGSVSSLLAMTFGLPTITFEAPGDALPASRLGLPIPPGSMLGAPQNRKYTGTYHFGNTADPVYMGTCNGVFASCTFAGYALESQCHTGFRCVYDTVGDKGWRVDIRHHQIASVLTDVLESYPSVPACEPDDECVDCSNWKFFESNRSISTTTSQSTSTSSSMTRTSVCKTPGWWGGFLPAQEIMAVTNHAQDVWMRALQAQAHPKPLLQPAKLQHHVIHGDGLDVMIQRQPQAHLHPLLRPPRPQHHVIRGDGLDVMIRRRPWKLLHQH